MHYLQLWLMHRNIIPSKKPYSRMQKHIRAGIIFQKRKNELIASFWKFDTEVKLEVLSQLLGLNINVGVHRRPPKLGTSCSVKKNDSLNVVVASDDAAENRGIDLLYHVPFLDVYVRSSEFIVGGTAPPPTENIRSQLESIPAETSESNIIFSHLKQKVRQSFQTEKSVF